MVCRLCTIFKFPRKNIKIVSQIIRVFSSIKVAFLLISFYKPLIKLGTKKLGVKRREFHFCFKNRIHLNSYIVLQLYLMMILKIS